MSAMSIFVAPLVQPARRTSCPYMSARGAENLMERAGGDTLCDGLQRGEDRCTPAPRSFCSQGLPAGISRER